VDRDLIALRRTKAHHLGFAVQMCTVRYVGRFLVDDPLDVPWSVVEHLAAQLRIEDPSVVKRYTERAKTAYEHAWEIRDAYGYHPFEDPEWGRKFRAFLHGRAWTGASMAKALERVDEISAFRLGRVNLDKVPPNRLATMARVGLGSKAPILERTPEPKRTALLTSVVRHLEASAIDDALDLFSVLIQVKLISAARRATDRYWVAARGRMAKASRMLDGVFRLWSELDLVAESGADLETRARCGGRGGLRR
jgi:hypothetical protein